MSWRPKDWANPYQEGIHTGVNKLFNETSFNTYEAGADAMLRELKKQGTLIQGNRQYLVFIPGDEVEDG